MKATYFWADGELLVIEKQLWSSDINRDWAFLEDKPCVDCYTDEFGLRYGMFVKTREDHGLLSWSSVDPSTFPPEFKATLLLLGVS